MAIIKCKMCGGDLTLTEGVTTAECEYCGSVQTVPVANDEKKLTLFARANRLRAACEFDKAAGIYESIIADFPEEAEAYWGLVLCRYGIEYVDDPATGKKVPTCHRSSFESVMADSDLDQALENADAVARKIYREEAKQIEQLRKGIIAVSSSEQPYDIFICYKETDDKGQRTLDSVLGQDIYDALVTKGYRVFFSRITLEDKLGVEYEPYIFAALNSAKIMLAIGTDYEYYNAVWVKNEWNRYLKLMAADKSKHLIPCYKNLDAYDMPKEFVKLQAQDLGKVGAMQDLLRGIEKLHPLHTVPAPAAPAESVILQQVGSNANALLDRGNMALEDGEWSKANEYFDQVLNQDARCGEAYLGRLLAANRASGIAQFADRRLELYASRGYGTTHILEENLSVVNDVAAHNQVEDYLSEAQIRSMFSKYDRKYYTEQENRQKALEDERKALSTNNLLLRAQQFLTGPKKAALEAALDRIYSTLEASVKNAVEHDTKTAADKQADYNSFLEETTQEVIRQREQAFKKQEYLYQNALKVEKAAYSSYAYDAAAKLFRELKNYKDSKQKAADCAKKAWLIRQEQTAKDKKQRTVKLIVILAIVVACAIFVVSCVSIQTEQRRQEAAQQLIGTTYRGVYTYTGRYSSNYKSTDEITVTFIDETHCTVHIKDTTTSSSGKDVREYSCDTTYTVSTSGGKVVVDWEDYGPVEPFVYSSYQLKSDNWNSHVGVTLTKR